LDKVERSVAPDRESEGYIESLRRESELISRIKKAQRDNENCGLLLKVWNLESKSSLEWTKMESYEVENNFA
jgi:hypothetical protein